MKEHDLKCWPGPFQSVWDGSKPYEIRQNDRDYQVGDVLVLKEWCPFEKMFQGRWIRAEVSYMTPGGEWGLPSGLCVMGLRNVVQYRQGPVWR